jgi:hypothetical protein
MPGVTPAASPSPLPGAAPTNTDPGAATPPDASTSGSFDSNASQEYDPSKSPSEQPAATGDVKAEPQKQDAKSVTKLPIPGNLAKGPLPAIILGVIIVIFLIVLTLYAFTVR